MCGGFVVSPEFGGFIEDFYVRPAYEVGSIPGRKPEAYKYPHDGFDDLVEVGAGGTVIVVEVVFHDDLAGLGLTGQFHFPGTNAEYQTGLRGNTL